MVSHHARRHVLVRKKKRTDETAASEIVTAEIFYPGPKSFAYRTVITCDVIDRGRVVMTSTSAMPLIYRLDTDDTIIEVGGGWDAAAKQGGAERLNASHVIGTNLHKHVSGIETRMFVNIMLKVARQTNKPKVQLYKCDTPYERRTFEMLIEPEPNGCLKISHRLLEASPRIVPVFVREMPSHHSATSLLQHCSTCNRLRQNGAWGDAEAVLGVQKTTMQHPQSVTHVICNACYTSAFGKRSGETLYSAHKAMIESHRRTLLSPARGLPRKVSPKP